MPEFTETTGQRTETRRTALKVLGGLVGVGTTSAVGLGAFTQRGSAAIDDEDFTAQDVTLESDDGTVTDIWLRPDLTYSWSGLNAPPSETAFVVEVTTPDGGVAELGSETDDEIAAGTSGSDAYTFANRLSLISDGPWSTSDFEPGDDETETFGPITVSVTAKLRNGDEDSPYVDSADAEFSVTVTDSAVRFGGDGSGHGIEGEAQTGGSTGGGQADGGENSAGGDGADGGNGRGGGDSGNGGNGDGGNGGNDDRGSGDGPGGPPGGQGGDGNGPPGDPGGDGNGPPGDGGGPSDREGGDGRNR